MEGMNSTRRREVLLYFSGELAPVLVCQGYVWAHKPTSTDSCRRNSI